MTNRANQIETRNPIVALPSYQRLLDLDPQVADALQAVLKDLAADANERATNAWETSKGPMAVYWKAVGTYAKHIRAAVRHGMKADGPRASLGDVHDAMAPAIAQLVDYGKIELGTEASGHLVSAYRMTATKKGTN